MRIAFMLTSLGIGGTERQVISLAERMRARGHAVLIVTLLPPATDFWPTRVDVVHLDLRKSPMSLVRGMAQAVRVLRRFQPEILHCHNFHGNILGRVLKLALPRVLVISTIHNVHEGGWLRMTAYRLTDPLSGRTVAVCIAAMKRMIDAGATQAQKCDWIANGIDAEEFAPDPERRAAVRKQMGITNEFVWLAVGRIVPAKDHYNLLRAFAHVHAKDERAVLWIAGEGSGLYAERIQELAVNRELRGSLRWLGFRRDVAALLDAADAFVLSSAWEGMPLALGEALAMEKAVVATGVGGVRELVGECGTIVHAGNADVLARAMQEVMLSAEREQLGRAARTRIVENFNMDSTADEWEKMYVSALASHV